MQILPLPAFGDNYIWLIREGNKAAVVDPGDAAPVLNYLRAEGLTLTAILITHHHGDHVGGIREILATHPAPVFGLSGEPVAEMDHPLEDGAEFDVPGLPLRLTLLAVPGHTRRHGAYYGAKLLFCGDTLFGCGCGRLFEGSPPQMHTSLSRLAALPGDTQVYCAHEYTEANIRFALAVEPGNRALQARAVETRKLRAEGLATVPFPMSLELATNPFLRSDSPEVIASASARAGKSLENEVDVFTEVRQWKNEF